MTLAEFQQCIAAPEGRGVEFKQGLLGRRDISEYAVSIGNAGGGWLLMGVTDRPPRRVCAVATLSDEDTQQILRSVRDNAGIPVEISNLATPDGNVIVVRIPGRPRGQVFHTREGKYLTRSGEDTRGMTLAELDEIRREAGAELTAQALPGDWRPLVRPAGLEDLRALMNEAGAAPDLARLDDADLLRALGVVDPDGRLLVAGLLLVGRSEEIQRRLPHAGWSFFRMVSDTDYRQVERGHDCLVVALRRLRELVNLDNPIVTIKGVLAHGEFPRYPGLATRELLVNALVHRDYESPGGVVLKLHDDQLELSNPGGFLGGITPSTILHSPSTPRYPALFGALARIRVANAANLGVPRIFRDLLREGKEPPRYGLTGSFVVVTVSAGETRLGFITLGQEHPDLTADQWLILHHLARYREIDVDQAATLCQRPADQARDVLARLATRERLLEAGGSVGKGRYYRLTLPVYEKLGKALAYYVDSRLSRENLKGRVLTALATAPLSNAEVREITQLGRDDAKRLMISLRNEGLVTLRGARKGARWQLLRSVKE